MAEIQRLAHEIEDIKKIAENKEQRLNALKDQFFKDQTPTASANQNSTANATQSAVQAPQPIGVLLEQQKNKAAVPATKPVVAAAPAKTTAALSQVSSSNKVHKHHHHRHHSHGKKH